MWPRSPPTACCGSTAATAPGSRRATSRCPPDSAAGVHCSESLFSDRAAGQGGGMTTNPGPTVFVLFGATGDLAKRMVLPAFYTLAVEGLLPKDWMLVGN